MVYDCSTMGVCRQSRRVCFGAKPDKGFLDKKISPYPEVVRGRERELTTRPRESWWQERQERELVVGQERGGLVAGARERQLVAGEQRGVGGWRAERRSCGWTGERRTAEVGVEERRGSQHQTPSREARRQDRVQ